MRERRESGRGKKKDWRALLFFRPLLAPSGTVPGRPRHSLLLGERMRRPGPIPGVGGHQTKSLGQERREGRSRVVATGGLPALKRSWAGKGPTSRRRDLDLPDSDPATEWAKAPIPRSLDPPFLAPPHHTFRIGGYARPAEEQRGRWREFLPDSLVGGKGPKKSRAHGSGTGSPPPPSPRAFRPPFRLFPGPAPPGSLS